MVALRVLAMAEQKAVMLVVWLAESRAAETVLQTAAH